MTEQELGWMAGLLEGEGCFRVRSSPALLASGRRPVLTVSLAMCDEDVVRRAADLGGAKMRVVEEKVSNRRWNDRWRVTWSGADAERLMRLVQPLMGQRRAAKITECLAHPGLSHIPKGA